MSGATSYPQNENIVRLKVCWKQQALYGVLTILFLLVGVQIAGYLIFADDCLNVTIANDFFYDHSGANNRRRYRYIGVENSTLSKCSESCKQQLYRILSDNAEKVCMEEPVDITESSNLVLLAWWSKHRLFKNEVTVSAMTSEFRPEIIKSSYVWLIYRWFKVDEE